MDNSKVISDRILNDLDVDYIPLNDIIREFSGFTNHPTKNDFFNAIKMLKYLFANNSLKLLEGPEMKELVNPNEIFATLEENWNNYNEINYKFWISK